MTKLVQFRCGKCGRRLCETLPHAQVLCVRCNCWNSETTTIEKSTQRKRKQHGANIRQIRKDELSS